MDSDIGTSGSAGRPGLGLRRGRLRAALAAGTVVALSSTAVALVTAGSASAATTLRAAAEASGHYFGVAVGQGDLGNSTATNVAGTQFDMVTPENEMKWDTIEPNNGQYNFGPGDAIVNFATSHGDRMRGHNLVWHSQLPGWVTSLPLNQVPGAMESHITTEVSHYKGKIYAWDVVNEPFNDDGSFRQDVFYNAFGGGAAYIADALKTAHAADPAAKLYINDYNIEGENSKSNAMYSLAQTLLAEGAPLGGIGFESHFIVGQIPSDMQANMQRFANLGLDVAVTELDDRMPTPASSGNLQQQATDDSNVVKDCLAVARCVGLTQWNISDADSWVPGTFPGQGAATMFDNNYNPKPSYNSVLATLNAAPPTTTPPTTSPTTTPPTTSPTTTLPTTSPTTTPPTTTPPTTSPTTTPPTTSPGGGGCKVTDALNAWNNGMVENLTVTNTGSTAINNWNLVFTLPSGQTITSGWNATYSPSSGTVTATNMSYDASIPPGGSVYPGFQGTLTGSNAAPTSFTLNGVTCTIG